MTLLCLQWEFFTVRLFGPSCVLQIGLHPASTGSLHHFWRQIRTIALRTLAERAIRKSNNHSENGLLPLSYFKKRTGKEIMRCSSGRIYPEDTAVFPWSSLFQLFIQTLQRVWKYCSVLHDRNSEFWSYLQSWKHLLFGKILCPSEFTEAEVFSPQNYIDWHFYLGRVEGKSLFIQNVSF